MRSVFSYLTKRRGVTTARRIVFGRPGLVSACLALALGLFARPNSAQAIVPTFDFGDAPLPYPTVLNNNGARHAIVANVFLGQRIDAETDGQPNAGANGDDLNPATAGSDEDGVTFLTPLIPGQSATIQVVASTRGLLNAWMDFAANSSWAESGDQIFLNQQLGVGTNTLTITVPATAKAGPTYARFRFSLDGNITFSGPAGDGEVEDYLVTISVPLDFGDAPEQYPTLLANNGARHPIDPKFTLGGHVDTELDGQPSLGADGDDVVPAGAPDDEDGVTFLTAPLQAGATAQIEVFAAQAGRLDAWVDFNGNGSWADAGDQIFTSVALAAGVNPLSFSVPASASMGSTYARFRLSQQGGLSFDGLGPVGEVEDYRVTVIGELDFGDAPDSANGIYPTLLANNGARHVIVKGFQLGKNIDAEPDGLPSTGADKDDLTPTAGPDDEDGVTFLTPIAAGGTAQVQVEASQAGRLDAWVDFNVNGSWNDTGEKIFSNVSLVAGFNTLNFSVPATAVAGQTTYARFRFSSKGGLRPEGLAPDGEVEDYRVAIQPPMDFGDAPDRPYPTLLANNGARHIRNPDVFLGFLIDVEPDGQPNLTATGDDISPPGTTVPPDDEDGVTFTSPLHVGQVATVDVRASTSGRLNAWMDFNANGSWADKEDQIFRDQPLTGGVNSLSFNVPANVHLGATYARFRFNLQGGLSFDGPAADGEVEDYQVFLRDRPIPCDQSNKGSDFWLTFPANLAPDPDNPLKLTLDIVGPRSATGTVEIPGLGYQTNFVIPPTMKATIYLPKEADLGMANDEVQNNGIHVKSDADIAVYGLSRVLYTTDGYLGIPTTALGRGYVVQTYGNVHTGVQSLNGSQFGIVACDDDTTVAVLPSATVVGHAKGVVYNIHLNQGETYQLRDTNDAPHDLSGTLIVASKPVAVFGSHRCANIPNKNVWFCDYIVEQLLPVERAGRNFALIPLATRTGGDTIRVFPVQNKTAISVNGVNVATIDLGQYYQTTRSVPTQITASNPVLVMQYANSADFDPVTIVNADPFEVIIPSTDMFMSQYMVCVPDAGYVSYYLNVVAPTGSTVFRNGVAIPGGLFVPISTSGFSGAQVLVTPGVQTLTASGASGGPAPIGVTVYGWAEYDSFGWPGGMYFSDKTPPTLTCLQSNVTVLTKAECVTDLPDLRSLVDVFDNCTLGPNNPLVQNPEPGTPVTVGVHPVTMSVTDASGNTGFCVITVNVVDDGPVGIDCPPEITVPCQGTEGAVVEFNVKAQTSCGYPVEVVCDHLSGSLFPPGQTVVTCTATSPVGQTAGCTFLVTVQCLSIDFGPQPGTVEVKWTGGGTLQRATDPAGPYTDLPTAISPYRFTPPSNFGEFFRVRY
jgi:IgGFc binding protein/GEVED domain/HYR domain